MILRGNREHLNIQFLEHVQEVFSGRISKDLFFACKLVTNELMQNSVDHSTSERYYLYAGVWKNEFHAGVLDMGATIPAKLEQKYACSNDVEYLEVALKYGTGTRRQRPGGFGLYYFSDFLKENNGKLTILSRRAQVRRYFKTRRSQKNLLKYPLAGTWCFARFPLERAR